MKLPLHIPSADSIVNLVSDDEKRLKAHNSDTNSYKCKLKVRNKIIFKHEIFLNGIVLGSLISAK
jgi:hypothetical protein